MQFTLFKQNFVLQILSSEAQCLKLDDEINLKDKIISSAYGVLRTAVQKSTITQGSFYFYSVFDKYFKRFNQAYFRFYYAIMDIL